LLLGSILWAMKEHDAKCRWQARTSEKAQLREPYFREFLFHALQ
jgi:hypothetical protein